MLEQPAFINFVNTNSSSSFTYMQEPINHCKYMTPIIGVKNRPGKNLIMETRVRTFKQNCSKDYIYVYIK